MTGITCLIVMMFGSGHSGNKEVTTMTGNEIFPGALSTSGSGFHFPGATEGTSVWMRLTARLHAGRFDAMLAVGVPAPAGSVLAVHAARLTSTAEREALARSLRRAVYEAND